MNTIIKPHPPMLTDSARKEIVDGAEGDWPEYAQYVWDQLLKANTTEQLKWLFETTFQSAKQLQTIAEILKSTATKDSTVDAGQDSGWWTTEQAAAYLKLKVKTVREGALRGRIPGHKYPEDSPRGVWRFKKRELDRFLTGKAKKAPQKALEAW